jgi:hypothetical protein
LTRAVLRACALAMAVLLAAQPAGAQTSGSVGAAMAGAAGGSR